MKRIAALTVAVFVAVVGCSPAGRESIETIGDPLSAPVAAYAFDEASGTTALDATSNHLNGTLSNATRVAGKNGTAVKLTGGASSWVTVPDANPLDLTTGMTLEAWVNPTTLS